VPAYTDYWRQETESCGRELSALTKVTMGMMSKTAIASQIVPEQPQAKAMSDACMHRAVINADSGTGGCGDTAEGRVRRTRPRSHAQGENVNGLSPVLGLMSVRAADPWSDQP